MIMRNGRQVPESLADIAEILGTHVAINLMESFGGLDLRFPVRPKDDHPLVVELGRTDADALCHLMSGQKLYIPRIGSAGSTRAEVLRLEGLGKNRDEIARALDISARQVRRLSNMPGNENQMNLFGDD